MVEAGGLKCYPVHGDPTSWYYLPDQPHVAKTGESERPEFSFLMYTTPEQRGEEGITTAPGGVLGNPAMSRVNSPGCDSGPPSLVFGGAGGGGAGDRRRGGGVSCKALR